MAGFRENVFRENMKRRREILGMNQTDLARRMKAQGHAFHQQTIQRVEAGERPVRLDEAFAIADILESSVESMTRTYASGFADVVYAVEKLERESHNAYDGVLTSIADWHEAFDDLYAEFVQSGVKAGVEPDERAVLVSGWTLKALWVFEAADELLTMLNGIIAEPGTEWRDPVLTRDVPGALNWLEDETTSPLASMPEADRPPFVADQEPSVLMKRLRALAERDGEHQAEA